MAIQQSTKSSSKDSDSTDFDFDSKEFNSFLLCDSEHNFYTYQISDFKNIQFYNCKSLWKNAEYRFDSEFNIKFDDTINIEFKRSFLFPEDHILILLSKDFILEFF